MVLELELEPQNIARTPPKQGFHGNEPCRDRTCDHRIKRAEVQRISAVRQVCEHKEPAQRLIGQSKTGRTRRDHRLGWRAVDLPLTSARGARVGTTAPDTSASSRNKEANFEQPPGPSRCPNLTRPVYLVRELMSMTSTVSEKWIGPFLASNTRMSTGLRGWVFSLRCPFPA